MGAKPFAQVQQNREWKTVMGYCLICTKLGEKRAEDIAFVVPNVIQETRRRCSAAVVCFATICKFRLKHTYNFFVDDIVSLILREIHRSRDDYKTWVFVSLSNEKFRFI
jgi:hypothetical protein